MPALSLCDLDQRPDLLPWLVPLFSAAQAGRDHAVCGLPARMGLPPTGEDLRRCLGVLVAVGVKPDDGGGNDIAGALAICPYSDEQVTLWGPVCAASDGLETVGGRLLAGAHEALVEGGFATVRALVDVRNRHLRSFLLAHGLTAWKDTHICERALNQLPADPGGVRLALRRDHRAVGELFAEAFPDSQHHVPNLAARERDGYRHYLVEENGRIIAAAAVQDGGRRAWLKLIAVADHARRHGAGRRLLAGLLHHESRLGWRDIGLEVLADNTAAIAAFSAAGFHRSWTATILAGPA